MTDSHLETIFLFYPLTASLAVEEEAARIPRWRHDRLLGERPHFDEAMPLISPLQMV